FHAYKASFLPFLPGTPSGTVLRHQSRPRLQQKQARKAQMKKISRRKFLIGSAAAGAAAATYSPLGSARLFVPTRRSSKKAVVIGSGFGGSVATLRMAEAGIPVSLVEWGQVWRYSCEESFTVVSIPSLNMRLVDLICPDTSS